MRQCNEGFDQKEGEEDSSTVGGSAVSDVIHYFVRVGLDEMRHGRGRERGARWRPVGHP